MVQVVDDSVSGNNNPSLIMTDAPDIVYLKNDNRPHALISIRNESIVCLLDSGCSQTTLGKNSESLWNMCEMQTSKGLGGIHDAGGTIHEVLGTVDVPICYGGNKRIVNCLVAPSLASRVCLGFDFFRIFDITLVVPCDGNVSFHLHSTHLVEEQHSLTPAQEEKLQEIMSGFVVADPDHTLPFHTLLEHVIDTGLHPPFKLRQYSYSQEVVNVLQDCTRTLLKKGIIEPCPSSSWLNNLVVVRKPDGSFRICLDARRLNQITVSDAYPSPLLNDIFNNVGRPCWMNRIDLADAFCQTLLAKDSQEKTAFAVPRMGSFKYVRMPFGLKNAPATQARLMDLVFGSEHFPSILHYLDDIITFAETPEKSFELLTIVRDRLANAGLGINPKKIRLNLKRVKCLGKIFDADGMHTDPIKVQSIVDYPVPTSVTELKRFIGMCGWFSRHIANYAVISAPLHEFTTKRHRQQFQ
jgi:Reverse transcriptase (RNA-dependent DNA polymerase)